MREEDKHVDEVWLGHVERNLLSGSQSRNAAMAAMTDTPTTQNLDSVSTSIYRPIRLIQDL